MVHLLLSLDVHLQLLANLTAALISLLKPRCLGHLPSTLVQHPHSYSHSLRSRGQGLGSSATGAATPTFFPFFALILVGCCTSFPPNCTFQTSINSLGILWNKWDVVPIWWPARISFDNRDGTVRSGALSCLRIDSEVAGMKGYMRTERTYMRLVALETTCAHRVGLLVINCLPRPEDWR